MPFMLGLIIAIAVGTLAMLIVPWTGRSRMATRRQSPNLGRSLTFAAARSVTQEANAWTNVSRQASRQASQGFAARAQHYEDPYLMGYDVAGAELDECAGNFCLEPLEMTASTVPLSPDGGRCWMTSYDLMATNMPASGSTHSEDSAWKVTTYICHIPRLNAEERQRLLAAWGDEHRGS